MELYLAYCNTKAIKVKLWLVVAGFCWSFVDCWFYAGVITSLVAVLFLFLTPVRGEIGPALGLL